MVRWSFLTDMMNWREVLMVLIMKMHLSNYVKLSDNMHSTMNGILSLHLEQCVLRMCLRLLVNLKV